MRGRDRHSHSSQLSPPWPRPSISCLCWLSDWGELGNGDSLLPQLLIFESEQNHNRRAHEGNGTETQTSCPFCAEWLQLETQSHQDDYLCGTEPPIDSHEFILPDSQLGEPEFLSSLKLHQGCYFACDFDDRRQWPGAEQDVQCFLEPGQFFLR